MPGQGPPGMGDGCRIQLKINPDGEVNWQLKIQVKILSFCSFENIQAESMGVPSKIKAVKVFDDAGVELNDVVVTNSDDPPEVKKQKNITNLFKKNIFTFGSWVNSLMF